MPAQFHVTTGLRTIKGDDVSMQIKHSDVDLITDYKIDTFYGSIPHTDVDLITENVFNDYYATIISSDTEEIILS